MGMYGYPISEEDFQKDIEKEKAMSEEEKEEIVDSFLEEPKESKEEPKPQKVVEEEDESFLKKNAKKFAGFEPTFFEKLAPLVEKEDVDFLKKDMKIYSFLTLTCYGLGVALTFLFVVVLETMWLVPLAFAVLFGNSLISTFWWGQYWVYCIEGYKSKKEHKHIPIEEIAEMVPDFRKGELRPPFKKWNIIKFCLVVALGILIAF